MYVCKFKIRGKRLSHLYRGIFFVSLSKVSWGEVFVWMGHRCFEDSGEWDDAPFEMKSPALGWEQPLDRGRQFRFGSSSLDKWPGHDGVGLTSVHTLVFDLRALDYLSGTWLSCSDVLNHSLLRGKNPSALYVPSKVMTCVVVIVRFGVPFNFDVCMCKCQFFNFFSGWYFSGCCFYMKMFQFNTFYEKKTI